MTIHLDTTNEFARALLVAQGGDTIVIPKGITLVASFTLPQKPGGDWLRVA